MSAGPGLPIIFITRQAVKVWPIQKNQPSRSLTAHRIAGVSGRAHGKVVGSSHLHNLNAYNLVQP